ncbi:hypothetical protein K469DRAFT_579172, partial [Zopfia rhizophila CBS 207.26]
EDRDSKLANNIKRFKFTSAFDVTDVHPDTIIVKGCSFCYNLLDFRAGNAGRGNGTSMSDAAVIHFAKARPNLVNASLDCRIRFTDDSLLTLFTNCPYLRYV